MDIDKIKIAPFDERRDLLIPGDEMATLDICVRHFLSTAKEAIQDHGSFFVALSGGSTPKKIYQMVTSSPNKEKIDWSKVYLFWGDERAVGPEDPDSNYKMAMDAGFSKVPIPQEHIHRMRAEEQIEEQALAYENIIQKTLQGRPFDLVMLGMGDDGHTASLFPQTEALQAENRLVVANFVPQKNTWRMTLTFEAINAALNTAVYVIGESKKERLKKVFTDEFDPTRMPIQLIGTKESKALWIVDESAASLL